MLKKKFNFKKELNSLFNKLNIKKGSNIMLHSNAAGISQYTLLKKNRKKFYKIFFNSLLKKIGRGGTLVIPTYNYDFLKGKPEAVRPSASWGLDVGVLGICDTRYLEKGAF